MVVVDGQATPALYMRDRPFSESKELFPHTWPNSSMPSNKLSLETLPDDVLLDIFLLLSVLDILSLKQVCSAVFSPSF